MQNAVKDNHSDGVTHEYKTLLRISTRRTKKLLGLSPSTALHQGTWYFVIAGFYWSPYVERFSHAEERQAELCQTTGTSPDSHNTTGVALKHAT